MRNNVIRLSGRIDSSNAAELEKKILDRIEQDSLTDLQIDASRLEYISSAGLRVLLHIKKEVGSITITGVRSEVYELLEMTGFTQMMQIDMAYKKISVEGCEVIGEGQNGLVYRIGHDNVVKVYKNGDALEAIRHEREVARLALILGIPTAISCGIVEIEGGGYGSVFELLNAKSFSEVLIEEPDLMDWCVAEYTDLMKLLHTTEVPEGKLPSMKAQALEWVGRMKDTLPDAYGEKLQRLVEAVPERMTMIHGDLHTKNIVLTEGEVLVIDMDMLSVGHPVFELAQMYNSFIGFSERDPGIILRFQGYDHVTAETFWKKTLFAYLDTDDEKRIEEVQNKARCVSYARLIDWSIRHHGTEDPEACATRDWWREELISLLDQTQTLDF